MGYVIPTLSHLLEYYFFFKVLKFEVMWYPALCSYSLPFFVNSFFTKTFVLYLSSSLESNSSFFKYSLLEDLNVLQEHQENYEDPK